MDEDDIDTTKPAALDDWPVIETLLFGQFEDGDVLAAWEAWREARKRGKPIPDWVLEYLDSCAEKLVTGPPDYDNRESNRPFIANSLGFKGSGPGPWKKRENRAKLEDAISYVHQLLVEAGDDGSYKGISKHCDAAADKYGLDREQILKEMRKRYGNVIK